MSFSYFHEKLSLAVYEMYASNQPLKSRLKTSLRKHGFTAFPVETLPEEMREQFSKIKTALAGKVSWRLENYPDPIDRMKPTEVRSLLNDIFSLYQDVTREYYRRQFQGRKAASTKRGKDDRAIQQAIKKLLSPNIDEQP